MATTDEMMRAVYRFISTWLFLTDSLAAPIKVHMIDYASFGSHLPVLVTVADLDQARAWLATFTRAGFRLTAVEGTSPGYAFLGLTVDGTLLGHQVTAIIQCPALRSVPRDLRDRVEA